MCTYAHCVKNVSKFRLKCRQLRQFYDLVKKEKRLMRSYFDINIVGVHLNRYLHTVCVCVCVCVHLSFIDSSQSILDTIIHPNSGILYSPKALSTLFLFHPPEEFMQRDWKFCRTSRTVDQQKQSGSVMLVHSEVKCTSS